MMLPRDRRASELRGFGPVGLLAMGAILAGNLVVAPLSAILALVWARRSIGAGFGEETVFRGFLFERFGRLLGQGVWARTMIVLITSALFGLAHYADQGLVGVQQAGIVGLVFGTIFAVTGKLWTVIVAHAAFDVTAVFIIYQNLESYVAHLVFE